MFRELNRFFSFQKSVAQPHTSVVTLKLGKKNKTNIS